MSKKGGYIIIDFAEKPLSDTPTTIPGIYEKIEGNKGKVLLLSGLVFNDVEKPDAFAMFKVVSDDLVFRAYGYDITINDDDEVTIAVHNEGSIVSVSATGTATDEVGYITIDGVEKKLAGGGGGGGGGAKATISNSRSKTFTVIYADGTTENFSDKNKTVENVKAVLCEDGGTTVSEGYYVQGIYKGGPTQPTLLGTAAVLLSDCTINITN